MYNLYHGVLLLVFFPLTGCQKYLAKIPDTSLSIPNTIEGYKELLNRDLITANVTPGLGQLGCDDYHVSGPTLSVADALSRNAYCWAPDIYEGQSTLSWYAPYQAIYYCNVVLDGLRTPAVRDSFLQPAYRDLWGAALFYRSFMFFSLTETFGQPYRPSTADRDLGIVLRLGSSPSAVVGRSTVKNVMAQIIADLKEAIPLLAPTVPFSHRNWPCRPAAFALLSRVYLCMQDYPQAKLYADSCLGLYPALVDYNSLDTAASKPFPVSGNAEVLFQCSAVSYQMQYYYTSTIDTALYRSYDENDLRKAVFFRSTPSDTGHYFKGGYTGKVYLFSGIATDLVYLDRAECEARDSNRVAALEDLNTLLSRRWRTGTFVPYTAASAFEALTLVLAERRKECLFRECRWSDLRRLNQDPRLAITLKRVVDDTVFRIQPNDGRYTYPIPDDEIRLSGIPQNQR